MWAGIIILENESSSNGIKPKWYANRFNYVVDVASWVELSLYQWFCIFLATYSHYCVPNVKTCHLFLTDNQSIVEYHINSVLKPYVHNATSLSCFFNDPIHNQWCMSLKEWLLFHYASLREWNMLFIWNCGIMKIIFQTFFDNIKIKWLL